MLLCKASVEDDKIIKMVILVLAWFWKTESWSLSSSIHNPEHMNSTGILIERPFFHIFKIDDVKADNILYIWLCPWVFFLVSIHISNTYQPLFIGMHVFIVHNEKQVFSVQLHPNMTQYLWKLQFQLELGALPSGALKEDCSYSHYSCSASFLVYQESLAE